MSKENGQIIDTFSEIGVHSNDSQTCPCCQRFFSWDVEENAVPRSLTCGHLLCLTCVKTQWLDEGASNGFVYCLICSKKVGICAFNTLTTQYKPTTSGMISLTDSGSVDVSCSDSGSSGIISSSHNSTSGLDALLSQQTPVLTNDCNASGVWTRDHTGTAAPGTWIVANGAENIVVKLMTPVREVCESKSNVSLEESNNICSTAVTSKGGAECSMLESTCPTSTASFSLPENMVVSYIINPATEEKKMEEVEAPPTSYSEVITLPSHMLSSPDLNMKALLQMLDKNLEECPVEADNFCGNSLPMEDSVKVDECSIQSAVEEMPFAGSVYDTQVVHVSDAIGSSIHQMESEALKTELNSEVSTGNSLNHAVDQNLLLGSAAPYTVYFPNVSSGVTENDATSFIPAANFSTCPTVSAVDGEKLEGNNMLHYGWLAQENKTIAGRSLSKAKRSCRRRPMRQFQSEFFMSPYSNKENSPQLELVKLVRQKSQEGIAEKEEEPTVCLEKPEQKSPPENKSLDNPELALMKTIDMPSGKRVEDIYVVPSVWIHNEKKGPCNSSGVEAETPTAPAAVTNPYGRPAPRHLQQLPVKMFSQNFMANSASINGKLGQDSYNPHQHSSTGPLWVESRRTQLSTDSDVFSSKLDQNLSRAVKGHIITTLNAPKLELVPSLKDLCRSVMGIHGFQPLVNIHHDREHNVQTALPKGDPVLLSSLSLNKHLMPQQYVHEIMSPKEFLDMGESAASKDPKFIPGDEFNKSTVGSVPENSLGVDSSPFGQISDIAFQNFQDWNENCKEQAAQPGEKSTCDYVCLSENPLCHQEVDGDFKEAHTNGKSLPSKGGTGQETFGDNRKQSEVNNSKLEMSKMAGRNSQNQEPNAVYTPNTVGTKLKSSGSNYIIPILSFEHRDALSNSSVTDAAPGCDKLPVTNLSHPTCLYTQSNKRAGRMENRNHYPSLYANSHNAYSLLSEETFAQDLPYSDSDILPSLISIIRHIKCLSTVEPLNKPLADLTATLHLLYNAEKALCNANFVAYKQIKLQQDSKLGRLNLCILKLSDAVVVIGNTLQEWTKQSGSRCFKTMGVLTDLYNSNILALIDVITPYFHYICELIANCPSDTAGLKKQVWEANSVPTTSFSVANLHDKQSGDGWYKVGAVYPGGKSTSGIVPSCLEPTKAVQNCKFSYSSTDMGEVKNYIPKASLINQMGTPALKIMNTAKRGRPLGSRNGQKKARVSLLHKKSTLLHMKNKLGPVKLNNVAESQASFSETTNAFSSGAALSNAIIVNMSSRDCWNKDNAAVAQHPSQSVSLPASAHKTIPDVPLQLSEPDQAMPQWMMPLQSLDDIKGELPPTSCTSLGLSLPDGDHYTTHRSLSHVSLNQQPRTHIPDNALDTCNTLNYGEDRLAPTTSYPGTSESCTYLLRGEEGLMTTLDTLCLDPHNQYSLTLLNDIKDEQRTCSPLMGVSSLCGLNDRDHGDENVSSSEDNQLHLTLEASGLQLNAVDVTHEDFSNSSSFTFPEEGSKKMYEPAAAGNEDKDHCMTQTCEGNNSCAEEVANGTEPFLSGYSHH